MIQSNMPNLNQSIKAYIYIYIFFFFESIHVLLEGWFLFHIRGG